MKGIIIYKSKYGATKKYAEWLSEETGFKNMELDKVKVEDLAEYDTLVFGSGVYASGVPVTDFMKKNMNTLSGKKLIVFCDGASPYDEKAIQEVKERVMKDQLKDIPLFYCRGAWDMSAMGFMDRNLCKLLQKAVAKKNPADYEVWETALAEAGNDKKDWTDKKYLNPIIEEIKRI